MSVQLRDIINEWLPEDSKFEVGIPNDNDTIPEDYQGDLCYRVAPVYWSASIFGERVVYYYHSSYHVLQATDPMFFVKLESTLNHIAAAMECATCRNEIITQYSHDD